MLNCPFKYKEALLSFIKTQFYMLDLLSIAVPLKRLGQISSQISNTFHTRLLFASIHLAIHSANTCWPPTTCQVLCWMLEREQQMTEALSPCHYVLVEQTDVKYTSQVLHPEQGMTLQLFYLGSTIFMRTVVSEPHFSICQILFHSIFNWDYPLPWCI